MDRKLEIVFHIPDAEFDRDEYPADARFFPWDDGVQSVYVPFVQTGPDEYCDADGAPANWDTILANPYFICIRLV